MCFATGLRALCFGAVCAGLTLFYWVRRTWMDVEQVESLRKWIAD